MKPEVTMRPGYTCRGLREGEEKRQGRERKEHHGVCHNNGETGVR